LHKNRKFKSSAKVSVTCIICNSSFSR